MSTLETVTESAGLEPATRTMLLDFVRCDELNDAVEGHVAVPRTEAVAAWLRSVARLCRLTLQAEQEDPSFAKDGVYELAFDVPDAITSAGALYLGEDFRYDWLLLLVGWSKTGNFECRFKADGSAVKAYTEDIPLDWLVDGVFEPDYDCGQDTPADWREAGDVTPRVRFA